MARAGRALGCHSVRSAMLADRRTDGGKPPAMGGTARFGDAMMLAPSGCRPRVAALILYSWAWAADVQIILC